MLPAALSKKFPKLQADGAIKTSEPTPQYNCIAWSAKRDKKRWWQPIKEEKWDYWPPDVPDDCSFGSFVILFEKLGHKKCGLESNFDFFHKKIALYYSDEKISSDSAEEMGFTHVCDQLHTGAWTSKLAADEDIQHNSLEALEGNFGNEYGKVKQILKKRCGLIDISIRIFLKIKSLF